MFKDEYEVTVGVDFYSKTITVEKEPVQLQIWDTVCFYGCSAGRTFINQ